MSPYRRGRFGGRSLSSSRTATTYHMRRRTLHDRIMAGTIEPDERQRIEAELVATLNTLNHHDYDRALNFDLKLAEIERTKETT